MENQPTKEKRSILKQIVSFIFVSGIGWLLDFSIFTCLTAFFNLPVLMANCISSVPAVLWVFIFSSRKIFINQKTKLTLIQKYFIYFGYQLVLIVVISFAAQFLHTALVNNNLLFLPILQEYSESVAKILITPVTMALNFIVMKLLIEKL